MRNDILTTLSAGSGLNVRALTDELVAAERAPRQQLLDDRQARVEARISALGQFRAALDGVVAALDRRVTSGSLSGIPSVSDPSILGLRVDPGTTIPRLSLEVRQLARSQTLASAPLADAAAPVGQGSLTLRFGTVAGTEEATGFAAGAIADLVVTIGPADDSLTGVARAINQAAQQAGAPVQAQIITDAGGSRLLLRGASGEASGFVVDAGGAPGLAAFAFGVGSTGLARTQSATDALVAVDGLLLRRPANAIADLLPGARLTLAKAAPGTLVTVEAARDPAELAQAVRDLGAALNELAALGRQLTASGTGGATPGSLASDGSTRRALQGLGGLGVRQLLSTPGNPFTRLNDIGISIDREGNFKVDEARLARAVAQSPAGIESLLTAANARATTTTQDGPLRQLAASFRSVTEGVAGQPTALRREAESIARDRAALDTRIERLRSAYTRQFAGLDRIVGQSKSLQSYLKQQTDLWTRNPS